MPDLAVERTPSRRPPGRIPEIPVEVVSETTEWQRGARVRGESAGTEVVPTAAFYRCSFDGRELVME